MHLCKGNDMNTLEVKTDKEILTLVQRWLELVFTVLMLLLFGFLVYHQRANTGFFTDKFKLLEMLCLYVPIVLAISAMIIRAWTGHQQPARPFEAARSLLLGLGSLWLLMVFPFNFLHLADALPESIRFVLSWVTDDIGKIPLVLQSIIGPISAIMTTWHYLSVRHQHTTVLEQRVF